MTTPKPPAPRVWPGQLYSDPRRPGRSLRVETIPDPADPEGRVRCTTLTGKTPGRPVALKPDSLTDPRRYRYRKG